MNARDLDALLDLTSDEVAFLANLPANLRRYTFAQLMATADRVARSRSGVEAVIRGMQPQMPAVDRADMDRAEFRLRAWWKAIEAELRRRCDAGRAEP
jgi:hypothetical protein